MVRTCDQKLNYMETDNGKNEVKLKAEAKSYVVVLLRFPRLISLKV